jgi:hypothetical protein
MLGNLNCQVAKVCILLIAVALVAGAGACDGGSTSIRIHDWHDLDAIRDNMGGSYILMNDLDSTTAGYEELASTTANEGKGWQPISAFNATFTGTFDGQGHEICDLFIDRPEEVPVGIFGYVDERGVIKNLGVVNADVTGCIGVGGLVAESCGTVSNSYFTGSVTGSSGGGGLVGWNAGTVSNSYSSGSVTANYTAGGLVGGNDGTVSNSYSTGSVTGDWCVGGVVAFNNEGTVSNSYFTGSVTGNMGVGGLVAFNYESIMSNSYYNYDEVLINGENIITIGALFGEDFEQWLANDKFLDVNNRLPQENGYYLINDVSDFKELLAFGQNGTLKFRLKNDLDLATDPNFYIPYLAGEFDGNGHRISNLSFNFSFVSHIGLFGYLAPGGKVTQVGVGNVNITGASFVGGLVGANWEGTVSDSYSSGTVTGSATSKTISYEEDVGGLVGSNTGTVSNSYSTGSVTGNVKVGGLTGFNWGTVSNSYSTANVTGDWLVGGLVAMNPGTVDSSYSTGNVTSDGEVGGLVANNYGIVSDSFWDIQTSGQTISDGGTGKTTAEMKNIATFSGAAWDIIAVANPGDRNLAYIWNIVNGFTYPFLSWQSV